MTPGPDPLGTPAPPRDLDDDTVALGLLQQQIHSLQQTLNAIGGGSVIDAVVHYYSETNANADGAFTTS